MQDSVQIDGTNKIIMKTTVKIVDGKDDEYLIFVFFLQALSVKVSPRLDYIPYVSVR